MKRALSVFLLLLGLACLTASADPGDLNVGDYSVWTDLNTSYFTLGAIPTYRNAAMALYFNTNHLRFWEDNRSGGNIEDALERAHKYALAQQAQVGPNGFNFVHFCSDNNAGNDLSFFNTNIVTLLAAPGLLWNGTNYVNSSGVAATQSNKWRFIIGGSIPTGPNISSHFINGGPDEQMNNAATNTLTLTPGPIMTFDIFHYLNETAGWTNDIVNETHLREVSKYIGTDDEHPGTAGAFAFAVNELNHLIDTNTWTAIVDFDSAATALTNHCVIVEASRAGSSLSLTIHPDRHSMPFDMPDASIGRTNDCSNAFVMNPAYSNAFFEVIRLTNCPDGSYSVYEDGAYIGDTTATVLRGGYNWFSVTKGQMWLQRRQVLDYYRIRYGYDTNTLVPSSGGTTSGEQVYQSNAQSYWDAGDREDRLINDLQPEINEIQVLDTNIWAAATPTNHIITITAHGQIISFPSPGDQTYGVAPITLNASASSGLPVTYSVTSGPAIVSGNILTITNVGQVIVQASQAGDSTWPPTSPVSQTINVAQATLTVSLDANDKTYDGTAAAMIIDSDLIGVVGTDDVTLATGPATFSDKNVGEAKTLTVTDLSLVGRDAGKYALDSVTATATANILPAQLTISGVIVSDKTYNGDTTAIVNTSGAALVGIIDPDAVTLSGAAMGAFADANVGSAKPVAISGLTLDGADAANYQLTEPTGTASIAAAGTLISITSSANPAGVSNITFTATVSVIPPGGGLVTGNVIFRDGAVSLVTNILSGGAASFSTADLSPGTHDINAEYISDGNFLGSTGSLSQAVGSVLASNPMVVQRYAAGGVLIRVSDLLTNAFDLDGDMLSLVSVDTTSEFGGTITMQGNWICYQPPPGFTNSDGFSYVVADGLGLQTTGLVAIAVQTDVSPAQNISRVISGTNDVVAVRFFGIPQRVYTVQYATDTNSPDWQTIGTATASNTGVIQFLDSPPTDSPARMYRTTYP